jgi:hypothetical protein
MSSKDRHLEVHTFSLKLPLLLGALWTGAGTVTTSQVPFGPGGPGGPRMLSPGGPWNLQWVKF